MTSVLPVEGGEPEAGVPGEISLERLLNDPAVRSIVVPREILAAAEEIAAMSDVIGLERSILECLVRSILFLKRRHAGPASSGTVGNLS